MTWPIRGRNARRLMNTTPEDERVRTSISDHQFDIYDEDGNVRVDFLTGVREAVEAGDTAFLEHNVARLHESEMGHLLESLDADERLALVRLLGEDFDMAALTQVDEAIRLEIVEHLPNDQLAAA